VPILLIVGDEDAPCIEPNIFLKSVLPDAALCVLPRTSHLLNLEEPALLNGIIFTFLNAVDRRRWKVGAGGHDIHHCSMGGEP
jgi:pimeloyl-ACP methyl ester carboxylesterase